MTIKYRTKDGIADYEFSFEPVGEGYRAYIVNMPSYGTRDTRLSVTHRLVSGNRYYVCWDKPLHTVENLKKVVALWSDLTQAYIRTGRTIDQQMTDRQRSDQIVAGTFHDEMSRKERIPFSSNSTPQQLFMTVDVYDQIHKEIGKRDPEQGGPLGGNRENFVVEHFYFDKLAQRTGATYSPNYQHLNDLFQKKWNPVGINLLGFVHSHPTGFWRPSSGDLFYAEAILRGIPELEYLLLPIVRTERDGKFEIFPYAAVRSSNGVKIVQLHLEVLPNEPNWP